MEILRGQATGALLLTREEKRQKERRAEDEAQKRLEARPTLSPEKVTAPLRRRKRPATLYMTPRGRIVTG
jgi:hypothetical protein